MEDNVNKLPEGQEDPKDGVQQNTELVENDATEQTDSAVTTDTEETTQPEVDTTESAEEPVKDEVVEESVAEAESKAADTDSSEDQEDSNEEESEEEDEDTKLLESLHFENPTKEELMEALKKVSHMTNMRALDKALKEIKPPYESIQEKEKNVALESFLAEEGNEETDFVFKSEKIDDEFNDLFELLRSKKQKFFADLERAKEENLARKNEILEKLRELVDGEESTASINSLKELQQEFRKIGPVPGPQVKTMWANYNAILDRFYDNRSIYFELKELDRKKNLESKLELCEKAEQLEKVENIKEAIIQLNELHEEFKHIGPIPKDDQEPVWQRFKAASDKVYTKRKEFFDQLKSELSENAEKKMALGDKVQEFLSFNSDRITEWNKKTKDLLELQKQWEAIGGLPRDKAKEINKHFWSGFKQFFNNKSNFFKTLEGQREENLKKKQELLAKAEELKESSEWDRAAKELKALQNQWREIGPVPEKFRNVVYEQFKAACDQFFDRKRAQGDAKNAEFVENLKKKEEICSMLEAYLNSDTIELEEVYNLLDRYSDIGFVPRNAIKSSHARFDEVTDKLLNLEDLSESQRSELQTQVQISKLKNSPHSSQKINRKEMAIRRKISSLEGDIATLNRNMDFFANSKTADKLRADVENQIASTEKEIRESKKQLKLLNQI